jgi:hypothetical protein
MPNPTSIAMADDWAEPTEDKQAYLKRMQQRTTQAAIRRLAEAIKSSGNTRQRSLAIQIIHECQSRIREIDGV